MGKDKKEHHTGKAGTTKHLERNETRKKRLVEQLRRNLHNRKMQTRLRRNSDKSGNE